jgi:Xaa-Pro aminopeptidase
VVIFSKTKTAERRFNMKKHYRFYTSLLLLLPVFLCAQEHQSHFPPEEFKARWAKLFDKIGDQAVAVIQGASDDGGYSFFRQSNTFFYLSGVENKSSYLLLDGRSRKVTLYIPKTRAREDDRVLSLNNKARVLERTGVDDVLDAAEFKEIDADIVYTPFSPAERHAQSRYEILSANRQKANSFWEGEISRESHFISLLRTRYPRIEIRDLSPILDKMRNIKSQREIEMIRRASRLAALGITEAMRSTKAGVYEYELSAAARYIYLVNGSILDGYHSITASGVWNIADGHYYFNSSQLKDGDMILMDYAPDYGYYVTDIGRMWPVNGKFDPWQRTMCEVILQYHKAILTRLRPGVTAAQIMDEAKEAMEDVFAKTTFSKPIYEQAARRMVETGGGAFSHTVGMTVHDVGRYKSEPLQPGLVFAVDPALRVKEENIYMRIEDTVVITDDGMENLTRDAPMELDDIEKMIQENGLVQIRPPVYQPLKVF